MKKYFPLIGLLFLWASGLFMQVNHLPGFFICLWAVGSSVLAIAFILHLLHIAQLREDEFIPKLLIGLMVFVYMFGISMVTLYVNNTDPSEFTTKKKVEINTKQITPLYYDKN